MFKNAAFVASFLAVAVVGCKPRKEGAASSVKDAGDGTYRLGKSAVTRDGKFGGYYLMLCPELGGSFDANAFSQRCASVFLDYDKGSDTLKLNTFYEIPPNVQDTLIKRKVAAAQGDRNREMQQASSATRAAKAALDEARGSLRSLELSLADPSDGGVSVLERDLHALLPEAAGNLSIPAAMVTEEPAAGGATVALVKTVAPRRSWKADTGAEFCFCLNSETSFALGSLSKDCASLKADPNICRAQIVDGKYSATDCNCLNGSNVKYKSRGPSCATLAADPPDLCPSPEELSKQREAQKLQRIADLKEQIADAKVNAEQAVRDQQAQKPGAEAAVTAANQKLAEANTELQRVTQAGFSPNTVIAANFSVSEQQLASFQDSIYSGDWAKAPTVKVQSVPELVDAIRKAYGLTFDCMARDLFPNVRELQDCKYSSDQERFQKVAKQEATEGGLVVYQSFASTTMKRGRYYNPSLKYLTVVDASPTKVELRVDRLPGPDAVAGVYDDCQAGNCRSAKIASIQLGLTSAEEFSLVNTRTSRAFAFKKVEPAIRAGIYEHIVVNGEPKASNYRIDVTTPDDDTTIISVCGQNRDRTELLRFTLRCVDGSRTCVSQTPNFQGWSMEMKTDGEFTASFGRTIAFKMTGAEDMCDPDKLKKPEPAVTPAAVGRPVTGGAPGGPVTTPNRPAPSAPTPAGR